MVTLSHSPADSSILLDALASRLNGGLTVPLVPPGPKARHVICRRLQVELGVTLPETVLQLVAEGAADANTPPTVPQLRNAILQLANLAESEGRPLTEDLARCSLNSLEHTRQPQLRSITRQVCRYFQLKASDLKGPARHQRVVRARGVAMLLARQLTSKSLEQVGQHFGNRDHTTVMHACRKTESLLHSDPAIRRAVDELIAQLSAF